LIVPADFKMADFSDSHVVKVPTISLRTVLHDLGTVDFLDMDVQGAEVETIPADIDVLSQKVKRAVIATHSHSIHEVVGAPSNRPAGIALPTMAGGAAAGAALAASGRRLAAWSSLMAFSTGSTRRSSKARSFVCSSYSNAPAVS
jgi:methyltransferase FkbM-like protein